MLHNVLRGPSGSRMLGNGKVQHLATPMFEHEEHEQHLHADRADSEEVNRDHLPDVIVKECLSCLTGRSRKATQNPGYGTLGDDDAEHLQFTMDTRRTPQGIGNYHTFDQLANLATASQAGLVAGAAGGTSGPTTYETVRAASG